MKDKEKYELQAQQDWRNYTWEEIRFILREFWVEFRNYDLVLSSFKRKSGKVADIGCGIISVLNLLAEDINGVSEFIGIDPLMAEYKKVYEMDEKVSWKTGYAEDIPLNDEYVDMVVSSNALDHVEDIEKSFAEIFRILKKDGIFVLNIDLFEENTPPRNEGHPFNPTEKTLEKLIKENGFKILKTTKTKGIPCGVGEYAERRISNSESKQTIKYTSGIKEFVRDSIKDFLGRGSIGEIMFVCEKVC